MKRFSLCILVLGLLFLSACSAPDSSDTGLPSGSDGVLGQEFGDAAQTGMRNILESVDPAKTGSETPDTSDRNGNDEGSEPSASSGVPGESTPAKHQRRILRSRRLLHSQSRMSLPHPRKRRKNRLQNPQRNRLQQHSRRNRNLLLRKNPYSRLPNRKNRKRSTIMRLTQTPSGRS